MLGLCFGFARRPARPGPLFLPASFRSAGALAGRRRALANGTRRRRHARLKPRFFFPPQSRASWPRFVFSFFPPIPPARNCFGAPSRFLFDCFRCALRGRFSLRSVPLFPLPLVLFHPVSRPTFAPVLPAARHRAQFWRAFRSFFEVGIQAESKASRGKTPRGRGAGRRGREEGDEIFFKIMPSRSRKSTTSASGRRAQCPVGVTLRAFSLLRCGEPQAGRMI